MTGIRITGGTFKGRRIAVPKGGQARFTSAKVREAVFDLIGSVKDLAVLDLFAGAGSFTAEALSRGADFVTAVEIDRKTVALIGDNVKDLDLDKRCYVVNMDVRYAVPMLRRQGRRFDLIFVDPPYEMGHIAATVELLKKNRICRPHAHVVFEHSKRESVPSAEVLGWAVKTRKYGDTVLTVVAWEEESADSGRSEKGGRS